MISAIVPTMWLYPDRLRDIVYGLTQEPSIGEIILIVNNKIQANLSILNHSKTVVVIPQRNIGCNPAWNLGAKMASNDKLFFLNDDFIFDFSVCGLIEPHITEDKGLILSDTDSSPSDTPLRLSPIQWPGTKWIHGWACGFFVHKNVYNHIPDELKLHCGDNWLLDTIGKQHYVLRGISFSKDFSGTIGAVRRLDSSHPLYIDSTKDESLYENIKPSYMKYHTTTDESDIFLLTN